GGDGDFRERFRREALLHAGLDHPNVLPVYEAAESEAGYFIAMRLVRGPTMKDMILARHLDTDRALSVLDQIAEALDAAHATGLVHRDVKPQNILVAIQRNDHAYLTDFGLTKSGQGRDLTRTGQLLGSLDYMSPEQIESRPTTAASDIYSFAATAFEALAGV